MAEGFTKGDHAGEQAHPEEHESAPTSVQPIEPKDPYASGGKPTEQKQVLETNVKGKRGKGAQAQPHPETAGGQHATGSFTDSSADDSTSESGEENSSAKR